MGSRDYRQRESKKPKKATKKAAPPMVAAPLSVEPQVARKKKPAREDAQE